MTKTKNKQKQVSDDQEKGFPLIPPEIHFLADRYLVKLPLSDQHLQDPWELRIHVAKILENRLGDTVELTSMKVKRPHLLSRGVSRIRRREPCARAFVTVEF